MPKVAKAKGNSATRKANNSKHGRTFCQWCDKKIARGMAFCNQHHRETYRKFRNASERVGLDRKGPDALTGILGD